MKRPGTPTYPKLALRDQRIAELEDLVRTLRPAPFLEGGAMTLELERDNSPAPAVQYHCLNGCGADVSEPMVCLACYEASVREGLK